MQKEKSAGFIIVKQNANGMYHVLGLQVFGRIDVPKGHVEKNESDLQAAFRECEEESGLKITKKDMLWGRESINISRHHKDVILYLAKIPDLQEPSIQRNPETGMLEHDSFHWLTWEQAVYKCHPYLINGFIWARNKILQKEKERKNSM